MRNRNTNGTKLSLVEKILQAHPSIKADAVAMENLIALDDQRLHGNLDEWTYRTVADSIRKAALRRHRQANAEHYNRGHGQFNTVGSAFTLVTDRKAKK